MIEIDKIGKCSPSRLGMHSPEVGTFFQNLAVQKVHLKLSPTSPQLKIVLIGEDYGLKVSIRRKKAEPFLILPLVSDN